ncbi:MAG: hypothetical protein K5Q00_07345, partial [Gammaproteobacteria bacterium]|nr:hypothetical protein [Gammaproteobacteria bacterium]
IPSDLSTNGTMPQYIESLNWIVKTFGPNVTFGWQDNVWAGDTNGAVWLHQAVSNPALIAQHVVSEANFWKSMGVYSGAYKPDFLAFDKYELDYETNGNIINSAYYYEAPMWDVYLSYVGGMSQALDNIPIMLWQIPGAHLRTTTDAANEPNKNASTAPDYFLGDPTLDVSLSPTNNLASDLAALNPATDPTNPKNWTGVLTTLNSASFPDETLLEAASTCAPSLLFISAQVDCQNDVLTWHNSHLYNALHSNVFAILWGGGSTTGIASDSDSLDDNGWLAGRLKDYYANPIQLPDGN